MTGTPPTVDAEPEKLKAEKLKADRRRWKRDFDQRKRDEQVFIRGIIGDSEINGLIVRDYLRVEESFNPTKVNRAFWSWVIDNLRYE